MGRVAENIKIGAGLFYMLTMALLQSCSDRVAPPPTRLPPPLADPFTVLLDTAPPPKVHELQSGPPARVIMVPKTAGETYTVQDSTGKIRKIDLKPPTQSVARAPMATFTTFDTEQGLALSAVWSGYSDSKGNLWFGTGGGGVSRYDGKSFMTFSEKQGLTHGAVWCILEDQDSNIWFATRSGVSRYDGKTFTTFNTSLGLAHNDVKCILEDSKGNLWFGTLGGGVSKYDGNIFTTFNTSNGLIDNYVWSIEEDKKGNIWFGTQAGVNRFNGTVFTPFTIADGLAHNDVKSILEDKNGTMWFGTFGGGVSRFDGKQFTTLNTGSGLAHDAVWSLTEDKKGNLWIGTKGGGVSKYDGEKMTTIGTEQGLPHSEIMAIVEDKKGYLWFATYGAGVCRYEGESFSSLKLPEDMPRTAAFAITEDKAGNLWFATFGGGVCRYDGKYFTTFSTTQGLVNNEVWDITEDRTGKLWFGTNGGGAIAFDGNRFTSYTTDQGLGRNEIQCIYEDNTGNLWFGSFGGGASRFDGKQITTYTTKQGLANNTVWSITQDKNHNVWFTTNGGGVSRYDGKSFTTFTTAQGLAHNDVLSVLMDSSGNLWFGTYGGGVSRFDGKGFITYTTDHGLADNVIYDIAEDASGVIWFGTNLGYSGLKFSSSEGATNANTVLGAGLLHASNEELKKFTPVWDVYNKKTGYPLKDLNTNAICITKVGLPNTDKADIDILWGGFGDDKVFRFDPKAILRSHDTSIVYIQSIKPDEATICWHSLTRSASDSLTKVQQEAMAFGRILSETERDTLLKKFDDIRFDGISPFYPVPEQLILPYRHNRLSFEYGTVETSRNFLVRYQYKLEGYDDEWSPVTVHTSASYGNMDEGTYHFKIKARSPDGLWSEPTTYSFTVLPPWYRSWWAYGFYLILFGILLRLLHRYQKQRVIQKEREKAQKRELEHAKEIEKAYSELKSSQAQLIQSEKMASLGQLTAGIAHEIQNPLNFVNNFAEVNSELINEMKTELERGKVNDAKGIANTIDENEQKILFHGKRADAIVKSMLQHSRSSNGVKEPTDINALADEYLRLAYHGLRAKDKTFNATTKTDFDSSIGMINIVPQDIGRVILNLITNAFYAVCPPPPERGLITPNGVHNPTVIVSTKQWKSPLGDLGATKPRQWVEISVKDNGPGIPDSIKDKIFQPFFTTKPTGQGTGLGLSLSYDIIKAHEGDLRVETKEGEFAEFIITLPI